MLEEVGFGLGLGTRDRLVPRPLSPETELGVGLLGWGPGVLAEACVGCALGILVWSCSGLGV